MTACTATNIDGATRETYACEVTTPHRTHIGQGGLRQWSDPMVHGREVLDDLSREDALSTLIEKGARESLAAAMLDVATRYGCCPSRIITGLVEGGNRTAMLRHADGRFTVRYAYLLGGGPQMFSHR